MGLWKPDPRFAKRTSLPAPVQRVTVVAIVRGELKVVKIDKTALEMALRPTTIAENHSKTYNPKDHR